MESSASFTNEPDKEIASCIDNNENFTVTAGAGSGKTSSLINALQHIRDSHQLRLRAAGQRVVCITYTNAAVKIIKRRTNLDELFYISTIHGFMWDLISRYQKDIRSALKNHLIPERISHKEKDDHGNSKVAQKARQQLVRLREALQNIEYVDVFKYDNASRRDYINGKLDHDDVIDLASYMIQLNQPLQKIIGHLYPYIFIDEAQDTFINVMNALNTVTEKEGLPLIGYFGDPMQQIYEKRAGQFRAPLGAREIQKKKNYRCSQEVITLLNRIRTDLEQFPGDKNSIGSVELRLIQSEPGQGNRKTYTEEQLDKVILNFNSALNDFGWSDDNEVKFLFLTRQMIAHRLGFTKLNKLFTGPYSSKSSEDEFKEGEHYLLKPFINTIIPLIHARESNNWHLITSILRRDSAILDPSGKNKSKPLKTIHAEMHNAIELIYNSWQSSSTREILTLAIAQGIINPNDRLVLQLYRTPREEDFDEVLHSREKGDWLCDEFFSFRTNELTKFNEFISNMTPYSTQHGVKGDEFEKVLVVFDDTEASWSHYSFSRLLTPQTAGTAPTEGQYSKSLNLSYVCFSRAIKDLKIILFTSDPTKARKELIDSRFFKPEQITPIIKNHSVLM
ncbi:ATP-dependent helicase [Pseudomonas mandelii]|uniref:UvrD-helicase domain-containing protein n=1 Tax=Pseudomonas mandelii TaxID=75612 RepID=UPI0012B3CE45|nr:UvrD-helicase domain-containing protein [Pseudomonas mandelii]MSU93390.1 ATP-dependent helicase [Pseudomonas mandelii]